MHSAEIDDVDRLFARLERTPPPPGLTEGVMNAVAARARARRRIGQTAIAVALVLITALSFAVGHALRASGALALVGAVLEDVEVAQAAPFDVLLALAELVPWALTGLIVFGLVVLLIAARLALTPLVNRRLTPSVEG